MCREDNGRTLQLELGEPSDWSRRHPRPTPDVVTNDGGRRANRRAIRRAKSSTILTRWLGRCAAWRCSRLSGRERLVAGPTGARLALLLAPSAVAIRA